MNHTLCEARIVQSLVFVLALISWCLWQGKTAAEQVNGLAPSGNEPSLELYVPPQGLAGRVTIAGSDTMQPLMVKLAGAFMSFHPNAKFGVEGSGSGEAIREFMLGISYQRRGDKGRGKGTDGASSTDLLASSRPLTDQERKGFASHHGYEPVELSIAMDAVAIYVHKDNPLQGLTLDQLDGMFSSTFKRSQAGDLTTWGQVGLIDEWNRQPVHLYGRNKKSGTRDFFKHVALLDGELKQEVQELPGSASEILAIGQDPLAIGYAGVGFHTSLVRIVPLAERAGEPAILPGAESVANERYPLARPLYLYVNKNPNKLLDPVVAKFLKFVNSRQGQETVARANFYPLTAAQISENVEQLGHGPLVVQHESH